MASIPGSTHARHGHVNLHHRYVSRRTPSSVELDVVPALTLPDEPSPIQLVKRTSTGCDASDSGSGCELTGGSNISIPIAVGICVPLVLAGIVFIYLHRRHVKKLKAEDLNDQHKSLDFGFDPAMQLNKGKKGKKGKKGQPEMTNNDFEKSIRRPHGLSMDIDLGNPYMLPPQMHDSRESLHSLTRSLGHNAHDPYQNAVIAATSPSVRGSSRKGDDNESTRTGSTGRGFRQDNMNRNLLQNASRVSRSLPPGPPSAVELPNHETPLTPVLAQPLAPPAAVLRKDLPPVIHHSAAELDGNPRHSTASHDVNVIRHSNNYLASFVHSREASVGGRSGATSPDMQARVYSPPADHLESPPPRKESMKLSPLPQISIEDEFPGATDIAHGEIVVPPPPDATSRAPGGTGRLPDGLASPDTDASTPFYTPQDEAPAVHGLGVPGFDFGQAGNRLSIGRPLPPDDPTDNPEQRANRIRSFYKEYFNDTEAYAYAANGGEYYEDYGSEYLGDGAIFDPATGQFVVAQAPYAAPVTRRAMTPPPRGPPRFQSRPGQAGSAHGSMTPRSRAYSTVSASGMGARGPGARGRAPKKLPPPKDLRNLPTPHLLKEDAFALSIDFAPPARFREQAAGRPSSPFVESRPYSPSVPIVKTTLKSSFMELPSMPSPHALRRSGTFTALDFAPPPKIRDRGDGASDAGSIRSGRSNASAMSAAQLQHNIRAGAYRLSRVPTDLVGSKQDLSQSLKPTWKVGST